MWTHIFKWGKMSPFFSNNLKVKYKSGVPYTDRLHIIGMHGSRVTEDFTEGVPYSSIPPNYGTENVSSVVENSHRSQWHHFFISGQCENIAVQRTA